MCTEGIAESWSALKPPPSHNRLAVARRGVHHAVAWEHAWRRDRQELDQQRAGREQHQRDPDLRVVRRCRAYTQTRQLISTTKCSDA